MTTQAVQIELLNPSQIAAALAKRSVVYVPLGTYEWHGAHLPIGLDALTAHGVSCLAAERDGGLVCPPLYYGTGGGHSAYPWTIMVDAESIVPLLRATIARLTDFGVQTIVLFSGHFAFEQIEMIQALAAESAVESSGVSVEALSVSMAELEIAPDHAALFETTLLGALWPELVQIENLPPLATEPSIDPGGDQMGAQRHDPAHPLYGIFGPDPRAYNILHTPALLEAMVAWLVGRVRKGI